VCGLGLGGKGSGYEAVLLLDLGWGLWLMAYGYAEDFLVHMKDKLGDLCVVLGSLPLEILHPTPRLPSHSKPYRSTLRIRNAHHPRITIGS
jgi:hypothetical protein